MLVLLMKNRKCGMRYYFLNWPHVRAVCLILPGLFESIVHVLGE